MTFEVPPFLPYLIAYCSFFSIIYAGFNKTEQLLRTETKQRIGQWIGQPSDNKKTFDQEWTASFLELFDALFVPKERRSRSFPIPGFWRSAGFSLLFVLMLMIPFFVSEQIIITMFDKATIPSILATTLFVIILNIIPDCISIIETRFILKIMKESKYPWVYIVIDLAVTLIITYIALEASVLLLSIILADVPYAAMGNFSIEDYFNLIILQYDLIFFSIFIYSTFMTSFWIWLYVIGNLLVNVGNHIVGFRQFLDRHTLLEEKPLSVMGWLLIATMTVIFVSYVGIILLMPEVA